MKHKIDTTKYLRQMKCLPDVTPLCAICLIILTPFLVLPVGKGYSGIHVEVPEARYAQPLLLDRIVVQCGNDDRFDIEGKIFKGLNQLPEILSDRMEERSLTDKKVLLEVDEDTSWGDVTDIMRVIKNAGFEVSGFTEGNACFLDFVKLDSVYREKGLRMPDLKK